MTRTVIALCGAALVTAVAALSGRPTGQTSSSTTAQPGTTTSSTRAAGADATHMMLTGCLTRENDGTFKLTHVQAASTVPDRSVTTGAGATTTTASDARTAGS